MTVAPLVTLALRDAQYLGPDHHPAAKADANLATGAAHALQAVLRAARLSVQARPLVRLRQTSVTTKDDGEPRAISGIDHSKLHASPRLVIDAITRSRLKNRSIDYYQKWYIKTAGFPNDLRFS